MPAAEPVDLALPVDLPVVLAVAEVEWDRLDRAPGRTWFTCGAPSIHDRRAARLDPLAAPCAEARDLTDPDASLRLRVERLGLGASRVEVGGVPAGRARSFLAAVERGVAEAAAPEHPAHALWAVSTDRAALAAQGGRALDAAADLGAADCARRGEWLLAGAPDREAARAAMLARVGRSPDGCAAGLARAWDGPGDALLAAVGGGAGEAPGDARIAALRGSLGEWPEPLRPALTARLAGWEAERAAAETEARRAWQAAVDGLDPARRACFDALGPALAEGPTSSAAARDPAGAAGRVAAWPLPWALWTAEDGGGWLDDGRGGVAWRVALAPGVTLPVAAEGPTALVLGVVEVGAATGPGGRPRRVPTLRVSCVPSADLPAPLRPAWDPVAGWTVGRR